MLTLSNPSPGPLGNPDTATVTIINVSPAAWLLLDAGYRTTDPEQGLFLPEASASVAPQTGALLVRQPFDLRLSIPDCNCGLVGGPLDLNYYSGTVNLRPIITATC